MRAVRSESWKRSGFSVLWDPRALSTIIEPSAVLSMREFFALAKAWPDQLPGSHGDALVIAGLDGCLDSLSDDDATTWLENDLRPAVLKFQEHYENQAALILWLASGRTRLEMDLSDERYFWKISTSRNSRLALGRCLWAGAENEVSRILTGEQPNPDPDGECWVGLHHRRIS